MGRYKGVDCFFLTPIAHVRLRLRRYALDTKIKCPGDGEQFYHNAEITIGDEDQPLNAERTHGDLHPHDDPRWPKTCRNCNYEFVDEDHWQLNPDRLYESSDDRNPVTLHEAPPGAMWYADWYNMPGPDGRCLVVRCPNRHDWIIDSRASNCNRKDKEHWCWYREGVPPNITIVHPHPKSCTAGAGSIGTGSPGKKDYYHGFLRNGRLTDG